MSLVLAAALSIVAAIPLGCLIILAVLRHFTAHAPLSVARDWALAAIAVVLSYFLAAAVVSPILMLCRPIRGRLWGAMITGAMVGPATLGTIGLVGFLWWEPAGRLLLGDSHTTRDSLVHLTNLVLVVGVFGGMFGALVLRQQLQRSRSA